MDFLSRIPVPFGHELLYYEDVYRVVDAQSVRQYISEEDPNDEIDIFSMTSLGNLLLADGHSPNNPDNDEDEKLHRLSLAYEKLHTIPKLIIQELGSTVTILDLSNNNFDNFDFLKEFKALSTLICDRNNISSGTNIPYMPDLELLWMNHCHVDSLYPWAKKLQLSCPNLKILSLMGNPVAPSYLNGGNIYEYLQYRFFIISLFPKLQHLDDKAVADEERKEAEMVYRKPFVERFMMKSSHVHLPDYIRYLTDTVSGMLTPTPSFAQKERNFIV